MQSPFGQSPFAAIPTQQPAQDMPAPPADAAIDLTTGEALTYQTDDGKKHYWTKATLLGAWKSEAAVLAELKASEASLRKAVVNVYCNPAKDKGTENVDLGEGWKLKAVKALNFKCKSKNPAISDNDAVVSMLARIAAVGPEFALSAQALIRWKPDVSETEYQRLVAVGNADVNMLLAEVIEFSAGSPQVSVVPPKEPK